jgi:hypothetical protein
MLRPRHHGYDLRQPSPCHLRSREELLERRFAHALETGAMRRTSLRRHANILKRLLVHVSGLNRGLLMRTRFGVGTPRGLQGRGRTCSAGWSSSCSGCGRSSSRAARAATGAGSPSGPSLRDRSSTSASTPWSTQAATPRACGYLLGYAHRRDRQRRPGGASEFWRRSSRPARHRRQSWRRLSPSRRRGGLNDVETRGRVLPHGRNSW